MSSSYSSVFLECFKYKTAKPVLYTVYRTKQKTVRKEMIRKTDKV